MGSGDVMDYSTFLQCMGIFRHITVRVIYLCCICGVIRLRSRRPSPVAMWLPFFRLIVLPYRRYLRPSYTQRPLASSVLRSYIRKRGHPSWTSYFVEYRQVQDDHFAEKHFNFEVDGHNYHILRQVYAFVVFEIKRVVLISSSSENYFYFLMYLIAGLL
ncbi:hypothetical protein RB195_005737 [Necator americanus]|uniref:Uncharacterized protein n=1 Tax=Necator americanus TaxID=51031 RepID=A0ABR1BQV5_NECAM